MTENNLEVKHHKLSKHIIFCYLGILLALMLALFALVPNFAQLKQFWLQSAHLNAANIDTAINPPANNAQVLLASVMPSNTNQTIEPNTVQALNLLYAAEFSFKILHNKAQTLQIITLAQSLLTAEFAPMLTNLADNINKCTMLDKTQLLQALNDFQDFYQQQIKQGKLGIKTIAQFVKIEDQNFSIKNTQLLENIQILRISLEDGNFTDVNTKITNIINVAKNINEIIGEKAENLNQFAIDDNLVKFDEVFQLFYQVGSK
jgi:hypothetical protein